MGLLGFLSRLLAEILVALASYSLITLFITYKTGFLVNWPIAGTLPSLLLNWNRIHDWCTQILCQNGGTLVLKGPWFTTRDTLLTCNPDNIHHMLITNFTNFPKGADYSEMFDLLGDGIFNADSESWRWQRQLAHTHLNSSMFRRHLVKTSGEMVEKLMPILGSIARKGEVVDLQDVLLRFTFDSACGLVFGVEAHSVLRSVANPFGRAVDDAQEVIFNRYVVPGKVWKLLKWLKLGKERKLAEARVNIDNFIANCISSRREELRKPRDIDEQGSDLLTCYMESELGSSMLYNFHVQVLEDHPVLPRNSVMLFMKHGLMVRLRDRERMGCKECD
ncbi:hypothetical protein NE237_016876 [Protea cynaroides]|uniref:Cytochrome P450 n=1 Tax=Protea cynaroides TaxID=273540 RepID=A0A9Q0K6N6_9MAGN|nr:hypothetical protein NE237_016876 [Protea cynaroides]